ncbi:aldehyde dehydrogenase family protein [Alcaligenaceae bacterium]|nr:aldehyde dehydrogenase family protein [Alcaligenaceae bacterium]
MTWEPVGIVGVITPWNFPIAIPAWILTFRSADAKALLMVLVSRVDMPPSFIPLSKLPTRRQDKYGSKF